jgi:hypothetical protein
MSNMLRIAATVLMLFGLSASVVAPPPPAYAYGPGYYAAYPAPVAVGVADCWRCGWGWHRWR